MGIIPPNQIFGLGFIVNDLDSLTSLPERGLEKSQHLTGSFRPREFMCFVAKLFVDQLPGGGGESLVSTSL